jgi:hypothetical protein
MSLTLTQLRSAVRDQLDLPEEDDLPTPLIDLYLGEAFQQTAALHARWPAYEKVWDAVALEGGEGFALPTDADGHTPATIASVRDVTDPDGSFSLEFVPHEDAEGYFGDDEGRPDCYSLWGGVVYLWPKPSSSYAYKLRGWRHQDESWFGQAAGVPDLDSRLHRSLVHFACSRVYPQQEDEVLSEMYRQSWIASTQNVVEAIMRAEYQGRKIMGKGIRRRRRSGIRWTGI